MLLFPFQYGQNPTSAVAGWSGITISRRDRWAELKPSTYTTYDQGVNMMIVANEEFPGIAYDDERWLIVPPDSGYSQP